MQAELRVAPQDGVDRIGRWLVVADVGFVRLEIPNDVALGVFDGELIGSGDETALRVLEVLLVAKGKGLQNRGVGGLRRFCCRLGLGLRPYRHWHGNQSEGCSS